MELARLTPEEVVRHPMSDEEIVARVVAGETALFEVLMRRHNQRIYRTALAIVGRPSEAEDVMQQAYVNAYRHLAAFRNDAKFSTWLTRIAINESYARVRHREDIDPIDEHDEVHLTELNHDVDPERAALNAELRAALEAEVAALPPGYREVFMMREVEGLGTAETAALLDVTEDVVKTRLSRARSRLRQGLFERAGLTRADVFTFMGERCDLVVGSVFERLTRGLERPPA